MMDPESAELRDSICGTETCPDVIGVVSAGNASYSAACGFEAALDFCPEVPPDGPGDDAGPQAGADDGGVDEPLVDGGAEDAGL